MWNFGKSLESKQSSRKLCLIQTTLTAASQIYLVARVGRINSDFILPFPSLEERKMMDKSIFEHCVVGGLFPPPIPLLHCYSQWDWLPQHWEIPTAWCVRVVYGMCVSNPTTSGVMDRAWPQGWRHCKSGCPQAWCGFICWSVCYAYGLKYILKRKLILTRKYQVFCSKQSHNRIFPRLLKKTFVWDFSGETAGDVWWHFPSQCSSGLIPLSAVGTSLQVSLKVFWVLHI